MQRIVLPQIGGVEAGTVLRWHKGEGEVVERGDVLVEVETEQAMIEVASDASGTLREIVVRAGETVAAGAVLAFVGEASEPLPSPDSPLRVPVPLAMGEQEAGTSGQSLRAWQQGVLLCSRLVLALLTRAGVLSGLVVLALVLLGLPWRARKRT